MVVKAALRKADHDTVAMVKAGVYVTVRHGFCVLNDQHGQLCAFPFGEVCSGNACSVAIARFFNGDVDLGRGLSCEFFVEDVSLDIGPSVVASTGRAGLHHKGGR